LDYYLLLVINELAVAFYFIATLYKLTNVQLKNKQMKKNFTKIVMGLAVMFGAGAANAATITATVSGNWSNATTWSGGAAGATVGGFDNVVIPAGITVTLDMNVSVTSLLSSINVSGTLTSTSTNSLMITQGSLSGNGSMDLHYLELGTVGGLSFTGNLMAHHMVTSNANLNLGAQVTLTDTLCLKAGALTLGSGSLLMLNTNSNIKVDGGTLSIGGGILTATNDYNVMYVGTSKTTGIEIGGTGFKNLYINLSSSTQELSLIAATNTTVRGTLTHSMGRLKLNGGHLILKGDYIASNGSTISGSTVSDITMQMTASPTSAFMFTSGASTINDLHLDMPNTAEMTVKSDLAISGTLMFSGGNLAMDGSSMASTLKMNSGSEITVNQGGINLMSGAMFDGTSSYDANYIGLSRISGLTLSGSGLNNLSINTINPSDSISLNTNATVNGTLYLTKGCINLNGLKLDLKGNLSSTDNGWFQGNSMSQLAINTSGSLGDTIQFQSTRNALSSLTVNTGNGSNIMLDENLMVENIILTNGGITIYDNDLTVKSSGSITGYNMNKYIMIKGDGKLMMDVNVSPVLFVTFPVGTSNGYAAAHLQRVSGTNAMLGVNTHDGVWLMGTSGADMATTLSVVDRTWDITSPSASSINMNAKFDWTTSMEANGFDRAMAYVSQYSNNWDAVTPSQASTVTPGTYQLTRNSITSPGQFAVVDNLSALSVKEQEDVAFSLYPNPAHNNLTIAVIDNGGFTVEVFDALGNKAIADKTINGLSTDVDFSSLTAGVYFVKISNDKAQSVKRVVKQ
jgi:hypothetical protein